MQPRTKRQKEVLDYVTRFIDRNGHKPSYQQIARHLGVSSRGGVQRHIAALESQGLIARRRENGRFGIELPMQKIATDQVCAVEMIELEGDGESFAVFNRSLITVPRYLIGELPPGEIFALKTPDDRMIERHICEDDIIFFERRSYARRSEIIAAKTGNDRMLFGLYHQRGSETEIRPANPEHETAIFPADEITVEGVMRGLMRFPAIGTQ